MAEQEQIAERDQAPNVSFVVDERESFDALLEHQPLGVFLADPGRADVQTVERRHELVHGLGVGFGAPGDVSVGEETGEDTTPRLFFDEKRGDVVASRDRFRLTDRRASRHAPRAFDHRAMAALHEAHHVRLTVDGDRSMDDADAAFERHRFGHLGLGHAVHVRRDHGKAERQ